MGGIGPIEILILAFIGLLLLGVPIAIVLVVVLSQRKTGGARNDSALVAQLREENRRLRDELAAAKRRP